ncbi:MAG: hypothetical protein Kow0025_22790 [Thermodesulfovibrionales bacterium]
MFSKNIFESKQEKWFADLLDRDKDVLRWVRPPIGQMPIAYKGGIYNIDFVVETRNGKFFAIEIKARHEISDQDIEAKAKAGIAWCAAMNNATQQIWEYKLIPHDVVTPASSFLGIVSNAVRIALKS